MGRQTEQSENLNGKMVRYRNHEDEVLFINLHQ